MAIALLVIDDNLDQVTITKRALKGRGDYVIDSASDTPEGLRKLSAQPYDVVLCDFRLPTMSGVEFLKHLRTNGLDAPVIIVTAAGSERVAVEALQEGAYDYLVKDAAYEELLPSLIQRTVDRHREKQVRQRLEAERDQAQAALQVSYEELKGFLQFKDELIAKVSHEFRTPLTSIKEGVALLLENALGPVTSQQQEYLTVMEHDTDRLMELVNNVLDVSKAEAGQMKLQRRQTDARQLLDMTIQSFRALRGNRAVAVEGLPRALVFVDPHRMLQVFKNLLSNAIKFTADDGTITFRVERQDNQLAVSITDNGRGISASDLPKLFQKFSQVGVRDPNQPRGTGLGLVVCKELVELHQGRIDVTSELGRGTTFTVFLPLHSASVMLTESFRDVQVLAVFEKQQTIGLVAIQMTEPPGLADPELALRHAQLVEDIRRGIHRNDIVLDMDASWIVILAITEPAGMQAMVQRLAEGLQHPQPLRFGFAVYPDDSTEVTALFDAAKSRLDQGQDGQ